MTDTQCKGCSDFCPDMELGAASKAQWLKSRAKYYAVPKGSYLFRENDPCEAIYIVHKGLQVFLRSTKRSGKASWYRPAAIPQTLSA